MQAWRNIYYIDLCAFRQLTNYKSLFIGKLWSKGLDFTTVDSQKVWAESIGTIAIPLANGLLIKLDRVAYTLNCDFNLISLGQPWENNITFIDNEGHIGLI